MIQNIENNQQEQDEPLRQESSSNAIILREIDISGSGDKRAIIINDKDIEVIDPEYRLQKRFFGFKIILIAHILLSCSIIVSFFLFEYLHFYLMIYAFSIVLLSGLGLKGLTQTSKRLLKLFVYGAYWAMVSEIVGITVFDYFSSHYYLGLAISILKTRILREYQVEIIDTIKIKEAIRENVIDREVYANLVS